ncbi:MAG TPA: hypothetical protein VFV49_05420 [Thermoanaerobaculia bacterium]|nr:hypothetical protein [Thermoanaerobaculia bacterium]
MTSMRTLLGSLLLIAASTLQAARFDVVRNGEPVEGAEVCLFRAGAIEHPVTRFFASSEVICSPASEDVAIGVGTWNAFARKGTALISERVELVTAAEAKTKRPRLELMEAAALTSKVGEGQSPFVWVPRTRSAFPAGGSVPAGTVIPLVVAKGVIQRVAAPVTLAANESRTLENPAPRANRVDVVVPVIFRTTPEEVSEAPRIAVIDASGKPHAADVPLAKSDVAAGETLLFFREVPAGVLTASLSGKRWKSVETKLAAETTATAVVAEKALDARATTKLTVRWWAPADPSQLAAGRRICDEKADDAARFRARLLWCADRMRDLNEYTSPRECTATAEQVLPNDVLRGEAVFEDVAAGAYFVELEYPRLPVVRKKIEVAPRETSEIDAELRFFTFHGTITHGGEPIEAEVFGSISDATTGRYEAVMTRNPGAHPIRVRTCDGALDSFIVPEEAPVENAAYDLELADNRVIVDVVERKSGAPIPKARIRFYAMHDDPKIPDAVYFSGSKGPTDERGRAIVEPVLTNKRLRICALTPDHEESCAEPFVMGETLEKQVRLELNPLVKRAGRVITNSPIEYAQIAWFSRDGVRTEVVQGVKPDGTFTYQKPHAPGEFVVFSGDTHPLFASLHPRLADGEPFELRVPAAPRRTFTVTLSADSREDAAFVALRIGDVVVPINGLGVHLHPRGLQSAVTPGHSVTIPDVLATGPIRVILIPVSMAVRYGSNIELPLVPEIGTFPQQDLGDRVAVTFGEQTPRAKTHIVREGS